VRRQEPNKALFGGAKEKRKEKRWVRSHTSNGFSSQTKKIHMKACFFFSFFSFSYRTGYFLLSCFLSLLGDSEGNRLP